ncbi:putative HTH-type transcriptional regulator YdeL [Vallitalea longa]|uniref:HTH-type transcriptional regulator YdeL n=1 Tax=Vallitalea longa TaxID=2936439 RepID=A0A9W6DIJ7_9FIRM|nr:PLP-dependent aminotransferase family protein [Vallitalea longa]GKX31984.1 putative HTH-type transcriptional regulator YdeL [Vallitalea longa]
MIDLVPNLDIDSNRPLYVQLYEYIRDEILNERIAKNEKLPSIRQLANSLDISKTTIENAYQQLSVEGYLYSLPQKGYYASSFDKTFVTSKKDTYESVREQRVKKMIKYDFKNEYVEENNFDFNLWRKYMNRVLSYDYKKLYTVTDVQGELELRDEIVKYVRRSRGVSANTNRVIIGGGVQYLLNILSTLMKKININECAFEDPGFNRAKNIFMHNSFNIIPIPVREDGIDLNVLKKSNTKLCYVSPSHQFPTGTVMSVDQRIKLLKWASENKGYIIEDDYNSELRYSGKPIPSMQSFDKNENVIYLGSFSTILVPSIRISYMILPDKLINLYNESKNRYIQTTSKTEQLALASFMKEGMFEKHIRKLKKNYAKKNQLLIQAIKNYMGDKVDIGGIDSGLHMVLNINTDLSEKQIIEKALHNEILLSGIAEYTIVKRCKDKPIIILSYRGIDYDNIEKAVNLLSKIV